MAVRGLTTYSKAPNLASDHLWTALTPICPLVNTHIYIICLLGPHHGLTRMYQLPYPIALQHVSPQGYG